MLVLYVIENCRKNETVLFQLKKNHNESHKLYLDHLRWFHFFMFRSINQYNRQKFQIVELFENTPLLINKKIVNDSKIYRGKIVASFIFIYAITKISYIYLLRKEETQNLDHLLK